MRLRSLRVVDVPLTMWARGRFPYEALYVALLIGQALVTAVWVVYSPL